MDSLDPSLNEKSRSMTISPQVNHSGIRGAEFSPRPDGTRGLERRGPTAAGLLLDTLTVPGPWCPSRRSAGSGSCPPPTRPSAATGNVTGLSVALAPCG